MGRRIWAGEPLPEDLGSIVQVNVTYRKGYDEVEETIDQLRERGVRYVFHLGGLFLSETRPDIREGYREAYRSYARLADLGIIVHDETNPDGSRLSGPWREAYMEALWELGEITQVSVENATNTPDVFWLWDIVPSITFDVGHFIAAGMNVELVVGQLGDLVDKVDFVHLHRCGGATTERWLTDHYPLQEDAPELRAARSLVNQGDMHVILEVDWDVEESLEIARKYLGLS